MEKIFKTLIEKKQVDIIPYIKEYIDKHKNIEILVSCDSQNKRRNTIFGLTICLYRPKNGGHVLFNRFEVARIKDNYSRLIQEVWYCVELSEHIRENLDVKVKWIDIDINGLDKYDSNKVLKQALGMCNAYGYDVRYKHKPKEPALLTYAADKVCR